MGNCCIGFLLCVLCLTLCDFLPSLCSYVSLPLLPHFLSVPCSVDEAVVEEPQMDQNHSSGPKVELQSAPDHVDQELEDELLELDLEDNPSHQHQQKASCSLRFKTQTYFSKYINY